MTNPQFGYGRENQSTAQTKIHVSSRVFYDPCFASSKCRNVDRRLAEQELQPRVPGGTVHSISAWPSELVIHPTRIQANGRLTEGMSLARVQRNVDEQLRRDSMERRND
jgi:hypothetical protein